MLLSSFGILYLTEHSKQPYIARAYIRAASAYAQQAPCFLVWQTFADCGGSPNWRARSSAPGFREMSVPKANARYHVHEGMKAHTYVRSPEFSARSILFGLYVLLHVSVWISLQF